MRGVSALLGLLPGTSSLEWPARSPDRGLLVTAVVILLFGLIMVASASVAIAERQTGDALYYFYKQGAFALLGCGLGAVIFMVPMAVWQRLSFVLLAASLLVLLVVLVPGVGHSVNGARRWLDLGPFQVQVSEPARLALLVYLAGYVVRRGERVRMQLGGLVVPMVPIGLAGMLMLAEPDFGGTAILLAVSLIMVFIAGARLRYFILLIVLAAAILAVLAISSPYRMERLVSFLNPWADPYSSGFQLAQSLIAVGRGHMFGVGLGNSVQKLLYLPEAQTDFLFAVIAEEFGLVGTALVLGLFSALVWRGFVIAGRALEAGHTFGAYLAYALTSWLGLQAFINVAVNMGLLPTKGLTLPLMSYGGSSLLVMCSVIAMLLRVDCEARLLSGEASQSPQARARV